MRIFANREFLNARVHYGACAAKAEWGFVIGAISLSNCPWRLNRSLVAAVVQNGAPLGCEAQGFVFGRYSHKSAMPHCGHFGVRATQM